MPAKKSKKGGKDVFDRLARCFPEPVADVDPNEVQQAELSDTALNVTPAIPRVEVALRIQFRSSVPIVEGDLIQIYLPGFRGKATSFTLLSVMEAMNPARHFRAYWSGDAKKKKPGQPGKQILLLRCTRRVETQLLVMFAVPRWVGIVSPDKLAENSPKIKLDATMRCAEGGKISKQVFLSTSEVKKQPVLDELKEYGNLIATADQLGVLEESDAHMAEELSKEEVDQLWEAAQDRCPFRVGFQWHIAVSVFRAYEALAPLLKTMMENAVNFVRKREPLDIYKEVAQNYGVKIGAVIIFQEILTGLYGALYPELSGPVLFALRLLSMEPIDVARSFGITELPPVSLAQEIYSCFRTGDPKGLTKWTSVVSTLLLVSTGKVNIIGEGTQTAGLTPPVLFYGIKELPPMELQYIRELVEDDWYMFPCISLAYPNLTWSDEETFHTPDSAVLFEIHNPFDGLEMCDVSMYPYDREWLLPFFSSFRVKSVTVHEDRNGLTHVVLDMQGCLHGSMKDSLIPDEDRSVASMVTKKCRSVAEKSAYRARFVAEHTYLNIKLKERYRLHPQTLLRAQYVDHFFEVKRVSEAKTTVEEGTVNWQVCTSPAQMIDPVEGVIKHALWDSMPRKFALLTEQCFLARTRDKKVFEVSGIVLDFSTFICDFSGKGPRAMRRLLRKRVSHGPPLPVLEDVTK